MSIRVMTRVWDITVLDTAEKFVLLAMADAAADDGSRCYPGQERIAEKTSLSVRQVQRIQKRLTKLGYLERLTRGNVGRAARWHIHIPPQLPDTMSGSQDDTMSGSYPTSETSYLTSAPSNTTHPSGDSSEIHERNAANGPRAVPDRRRSESWDAYLKRVSG